MQKVKKWEWLPVIGCIYQIFVSPRDREKYMYYPEIWWEYQIFSAAFLLFATLCVIAMCVVSLVRH